MNVEHLRLALGASAFFLDFWWKLGSLFASFDSLNGSARSQACCECFPPGTLRNLHPGNPSQIDDTTVTKQ